MKSNYYFVIILLTAFLVGCKSGANNESDNEYDNETDTTNIQNVDATIAEVDTSSVVEEDIVIDDENYSEPEVKEAQKEIIEKYGIQWDFCTCIEKGDSVNAALMEASDEDFDAVMERSDYIDGKCKGLLIQRNATPEERAKHQAKVNKCLSDN